MAVGTRARILAAIGPVIAVVAGWSRRIHWLLLGVLAALAYGVQAQEPSRSATATRADASSLLFRDDRLIASPGPSDAWILLSKQIRTISLRTTVPLSAGRGVPDECVLLCVTTESARDVLVQVQKLLADDEWRYTWHPTTRDPARRGYELRRRQVSPRELLERRVSAATSRLERLARLASDGTDWRKVSQTEPDLGNMIRQPIHKSWIQLASSLSRPQLRAVLSGHPQEIQIGALAPQHRALVRTAIGNTSTVVSKNRDGTTQIAFDASQLDTGRLVFSATRGGSGRSGDLGIRLRIHSGGNTTGGFGAGGEVLFPDRHPEYRGDRAAAQQHRVEALDHDPRTRKTVSISRSASRQGKERWICSYLREWSRQTGYPVAAWYPEVQERRDTQLQKPIVSRPAFEALQLLLEDCGGEWEKDGTWIRIRDTGPDRNQEDE